MAWRANAARESFANRVIFGPFQFDGIIGADTDDKTEAWRGPYAQCYSVRPNRGEAADGWGTALSAGISEEQVTGDFGVNS
jgi:hypothetical protein